MGFLSIGCRLVDGTLLPVSGAPPQAAPVPRTFTLTLTGLTTGEARPGAHALIGYTLDPETGTEVRQWGTAPGDDTYGTGVNPTDFLSGDGGALFLTVVVDGETVTASAPIRHAAPVAAGRLGDVTLDAGDTSPITTAGDFTFSGTSVFTLTTAPAGMTIDAATGEIDASGVSAVSAASVVVRLSDAKDTSRYAESGFSLTVADVVEESVTEDFTLSQTADNELEIDGVTGMVTITVSAPAVYAGYDAGNGPGVFTFDSADLAAGPVNLVPPVIMDDGSPAEGEMLTFTPGLWVYDPDNGGLGAASWQWQADAAGDGTFANITGATSDSHAITSDEAGDDLRVVESLSDAGGVRTVESPSVSVEGPTTTWSTLLLDDFGAANGYALDDDVPTASANWEIFERTSIDVAAKINPLGAAKITTTDGFEVIRISYTGAIGDDQAVEVVVDEIVEENSGRAALTLVVRAGAPQADPPMVRAFFNPAASILAIVQDDGGVVTLREDVPYTPLVAGDVARLEIVGTTATVTVNGAVIGTLSGISLTGGKPAWGASLSKNGDTISLAYAKIEEYA
jgi:hypothetical protein